jgi:hypothetical protein
VFKESSWFVLHIIVYASSLKKDLRAINCVSSANTSLRVKQHVNALLHVEDIGYRLLLSVLLGMFLNVKHTLHFSDIMSVKMSTKYNKINSPTCFGACTSPS